jgi:hypothetical protein
MAASLAETAAMAVGLIPVWKRVGPELQAELARYWLENGAMLDASKAAERAPQVVCVARQDGRIVGVATAYPRIVPLLRQPMYYLRMHIAKEARNQALSIPFLKASFEEIERQELAKEQLLCIGVILQLQNERLAAHYNEAYWRPTQFVFAGYSRDNQQVRVRYFKDVRLPAPAVIRRKPRAAAGA